MFPIISLLPLLERRLTYDSSLFTFYRLILGHLDKNPDNLAIVMEKVVNTMQAVIQRTSQVDDKSFSSTPKSKELKLIQSKSDIEHPPCIHVATRIQ